MTSKSRSVTPSLACAVLQSIKDDGKLLALLQENFDGFSKAMDLTPEQIDALKAGGLRVMLETGNDASVLCTNVITFVTAQTITA
jgi:hypothetical protein